MISLGGVWLSALETACACAMRIHERLHVSEHVTLLTITGPPTGTLCRRYLSTVLSYIANRAIAKLLNTTTEQMLEASAKEILETVERTKDVHTALLELQGAELVRTCVAFANSCVPVRALCERTLHMPLHA